MSVGPLTLIVLGTLLAAGAMTLLLDAFASLCFRPLQEIQGLRPADESHSGVLADARPPSRPGI